LVNFRARPGARPSRTSRLSPARAAHRVCAGSTSMGAEGAPATISAAAAVGADMNHPDTLRQYADRIFGRFPELFVFLGSPWLEQQFDLTAGGKPTIMDRTSDVMVQLALGKKVAPVAAQTIGVRPLQEPETREGSMSPFSRSRRLLLAKNSVGAVAVPKRPWTSEDLGLLKASLDYHRADGEAATTGAAVQPAEDEPVVPRRRGGRLNTRNRSLPTPTSTEVEPSMSPPLAPCGLSLRVDTWGGERKAPCGLGDIHLGVGCNPAEIETLPVLLSAASLTRLSPARRRSFQDADDPGKPVLSAPGSYDPWEDVGIDYMVGGGVAPSTAGDGRDAAEGASASPH